MPAATKAPAKAAATKAVAAKAAGRRRIEYMPLDAIARAARNPKEHNQAAIKASVDRFGFVAPMVIDDRTGQLVAGHGRLDDLLARRDAGQDPPDGIVVRGGKWTAPVVRGWASRSDREAEGYGVGDNRAGELGGWDDRALAELLEELADEDPDLLAATGFDTDDLDRLLRATDTLGNRATEFLGGTATDDDTSSGGGSSPGETVIVSWIVTPEERTTIRAAIARAQEQLGLDTSPAGLVAIAHHYLEGTS